MVELNKVLIDGVVTDSKQIEVNKSMNEFDATSSFKITIDNYIGMNDDTFSLNDEVEIYADLDINPPTTKIFTGVIENIKYSGDEQKEKIILSGRDYGCILQDIIISPRIFIDQEISSIIKSIMIQNAIGTGITWNNINVTTVKLDKITFNNKSLYDCIKDLATLAGFYFYVDVDKDLHFEERNSISSGETFSKGNIISSTFTDTDFDIFNKVIVYGDRQLTGAQEVFGVQAGSVYALDDKPSNVVVTGSPYIPDNVIQPGGILNVNDPLNENVHFLVDYQAAQVILTSGTTAGDNVGWTGSGVYIDYQRSSPLISIKQDTTSQSSYGKKDKIIVDRNIKDIYEANKKATSYLSEHKDPTLMGNIDVYAITNITPGHTCIVDMPFNNIISQTYTILEAAYVFNIKNNFSNKVLRLKLNKKVKNFIDYFKEQELRLRALEGTMIDTGITNLETATGSVTVDTNYYAISRDIGSAFYFHIPGHNLFNSDSSLLGDMRAGSSVISGGSW